MPPRDLGALLQYLMQTRSLDQLVSSLLAQWGPKNRQMLSTKFLPPRLIEKNQDTIERVRYRTVAAMDGTRYSPAQLVDGGELYGKMHYRVGHSDLARQIAGPDYDQILAYLNRNMGMTAAAQVIGLFNTMVVQAMVEHDELANWEAMVFNTLTRRGDNGYFEYDEVPDFNAYQRVSVGVDWTDKDVDPWTSDIVPRLTWLQDRGYAIAGVRVVTSWKAIQQLADHPATARRIVIAPLATGQSVSEAVGMVSQDDVIRIFQNKLGVMSVDSHDLRVQTKTGEVRAYPEDHMTFIASTGLPETVRYNVDNPADVLVVDDVLGFSAIGTANGRSAPGRGAAMRVFDQQKDARIEFEGWQATCPVILEPSAITDLKDIDLGPIS